MYVYMAYNWADIGYYCNNYICKFFNFATFELITIITYAYRYTFIAIRINKSTE